MASPSGPATDMPVGSDRDARSLREKIYWAKRMVNLLATQKAEMGQHVREHSREIWQRLYGLVNATGGMNRAKKRFTNAKGVLNDWEADVAEMEGRLRDIEAERGVPSRDWESREDSSGTTCHVDNNNKSTTGKLTLGDLDKQAERTQIEANTRMDRRTRQVPTSGLGLLTVVGEGTVAPEEEPRIAGTAVKRGASSFDEPQQTATACSARAIKRRHVEPGEDLEGESHLSNHDHVSLMFQASNGTSLTDSAHRLSDAPSQYVLKSRNIWRS